MATEPAFDAFSQRRDTGVKQRTKERKDVYLDPNRYRLPPNRTLRTYAQQLDMTVAPEKVASQKLAESLAEVVPEINQGLAIEQVELNKAKIEEGKRLALAKEARNEGNKEFFQDEWHEYGYDKTKAFLQGEDLGRLLEIESLNRPLDKPYQEWYQEWYADKDKRGLTMIHPEFLEEYNASFQQSLQVAEGKDAQRLYELKQEELMSTSQEMVRRSLDTAYYDPEVIIDNNWWQLIKADVQLTSAWDNPTMDKFKWNTISDLAKRTNDPSLLYILYENGGPDGKLPALIDNPDYTKQITDLHKTLVKQNKAAQAKAISDADAVVTKSKTLNNENKRFINKELGSPDNPFASVFGDTDDSYKNQDYATFYDDEYLAEYQRNGGDYKAAAEFAKEATLAEAQRLNDLDPLLVAARRARNEFNLNADTKMMSLLQTKDGANNPQGMKLILDAYKAETLGIDSKDAKGIAFWNELGPKHKKLLFKVGRKLAIREQIRLKEMKEKATINNTQAEQIINDARVVEDYQTQDEIKAQNKKKKTK